VQFHHFARFVPTLFGQARARGNVLTESMFGVSLTSSDVTYQ
jgi:hypothetical protein